MLIAYCPPDDRVPGDKIDHDDYIYHYYDDHTEFKMWQGSLPHKKGIPRLRSLMREII